MKSLAINDLSETQQVAFVWVYCAKPFHFLVEIICKLGAEIPLDWRMFSCHCSCTTSIYKISLEISHANLGVDFLHPFYPSQIWFCESAENYGRDWGGERGRKGEGGVTEDNLVSLCNLSDN